MKNILSVDVELWAHRDLLSDRVDAEEDAATLRSSMKTLIDLFAKHGQTATFFVLGEVAEKFPDVVKEIVKAGHEVGSHGWNHTRVDSMDEATFRSDLKRSVEVVSRVAGVKPVGFRAPQFSLPRGAGWPIKVLIEEGFRYDSSVFPSHTLLYGVSSGFTKPYYPSLDDAYTLGEQRHLAEFPLLSTEMLNQRFPASGGFWLRLFGADFIARAVRKINEGGAPAVVYLHNWEIARLQLKGWTLRDVYVNWGIPVTSMLESLLRKVNFCSGLEVVGDPDTSYKN